MFVASLGLVTIFCAVLVFSIVDAQKPNIVLFLTDDQDLLLNSLTAMPHLDQFVISKGVTLTNAFVNTPICCPSRSTLLTGKHLHNTHVYNNSLSGNCSSSEWQKNYEKHTFSSFLKSLGGYTTFYAGKYLNEYGSQASGGVEHIPPGYDWWIGLKGNSKYYNYILSVNGTLKNVTDQYLTDVMKSYALEFLNQKHLETSPFMMVLATPAAHAPFTPAPRHSHLFPNAKAARTPSFNHSGLGKHWLVNMPPKSLPDGEKLDDIQRRRLQTLVSVDEMIQEVLLKLSSMGILDDTYVIFTSDNGYHIGQFTQPWDKRQPYETDLRVPLFLRGPLIIQNSLSDYPVSFVDLAPSILDMAGLLETAENVTCLDGVSFLSKITEESRPTSSRVESEEERFLLIEYFGEGDVTKIDPNCPWNYDPNISQCSVESWCKCQDSRNNTYSCIRHLGKNVDFKFCSFHDGANFHEVYDLKRDPYELENVYLTLDSQTEENYESLLNRLKNCKGKTCQVASINST